MKITIDTKEDSKEDILRAIDLLRSLAHKDYKTNVESNTNVVNNDSVPAMDMFNIETKSPVMNMFNQTETKDSVPVENVFADTKKPEEKPPGLIFLD